jgi:Flp pilus assembly protein TadD
MNSTLTEEKLQEAWNLVHARKYDEALSVYAKLAKRNRYNAWIWFQYGSAAGTAGRMDLLDHMWGKALELEPDNSTLLLQMGHQYQAFRLPKKAKSSFERAAILDPMGINPRMAMAISFEREHRFAEARDIIASCLALDPRDDQARYYAAFLNRRENKFEEAEQGLRDLIASEPKHPYVVYASRYELAEVLDRTGRFDEAMKALVEAKKIVAGIADTDGMLRVYSELADGNLRATQALPANILQVWNRVFPEKKRVPVPRLAFLGGHPRSGTTLLEQILGAHPQISALDEPTALDHAIFQPFGVSPLVNPARLNVMRTQYVQKILRELGSDENGKVILDKNPSPTGRLRFLLRVFPELRVVIALRDPRDVVMSCYFQNIPLNATNANFLSLERTCVHYSNLMSAWLAVRRWEGFTWVETRYEDVVKSPIKEGRRVTEFLGLEWVDAQARFHEKADKTRMYSPTYHDASQPIYTRSVCRWRAYEKYLTPVQALLEPFCKELGYS